MDHGPEPTIDVDKVMRVTLLKGKDVSSKQQEIQLHFSMSSRMYIPFHERYIPVLLKKKSIIDLVLKEVNLHVFSRLEKRKRTHSSNKV